MGSPLKEGKVRREVDKSNLWQIIFDFIYSAPQLCAFNKQQYKTNIIGLGVQRLDNIYIWAKLPKAFSLVHHTPNLFYNQSFLDFYTGNTY